MPKKSTSPTQRSLAKLRAEGFTAWIAERWNPFAKIRQDLGGFGDILAWKAGVGVLAIQTTTTAHQAARLAKIAGNPKAEEWIRAGAGLHVHGWVARKVKRGGLAKRWDCTVREVTLADFYPATLADYFEATPVTVPDGHDEPEIDAAEVPF